ncbi:MAG: hypothetical protein AB8B55_11195 [Mariniblastus sp.]
MDKLAFSVALIRKTQNQTVRWLARLNPTTLMLDFVIAQRLESETFRESATREVAWQLGLDRQRDFLVSNMAQVNLEFIDMLPSHFEKTNNKISFYNVEIYRQKVAEQLDSDPSNIWVNSEEICNGVTDSGRKFNPVVQYLINRSNVIQSWESFSGR